MDKTAKDGERSMGNKLKEWSNVSGKAAEKFFNPQFKAVMEIIRLKDDQIRSFVVGKRLGDAEIVPANLGLKELVKKAKSNLNRREFLAATTDLDIFHDVVKNITLEINSIENKVDEVHHDFLFKDLSSEQQNRLLGLKTKFQEKKASLEKEAGMRDFLHNTFSTRGRALGAWEKRYPNEVGKFKNGISSLLQKSEGLFSALIEILKEMAVARSVRKPDDYLKAAAKIHKIFHGYEQGKGGYKDFYNNVLKEYIDKMEKYYQRNATQTAAELGAQEVPGTVVHPSTSEPVAAPEATPADRMRENLTQPTQPTQPTQLALPGVKPLAVENIPVSKEEEAQSTLDLLDKIHSKEEPKTPPVEEPRIRIQTHHKFYSSLEALSGESPTMLALFIKKYANSIKIKDPKVSFSLLKVAQQIKG